MRRPEVHEHERAGAVGVLGHARREARLAEQRRLLVAGDAAHRHARPARAVAGAVMPKRPLDGRTSGRHERGHAEQRRAAPATTPARRCRRAACGSRSTVRWRARRRGAAGEVPQHPRVDGAERQVGGALDAAFGEQPLELRRREVRVEHEAGAGAHERLGGPRPSSASHRAAVRRSCQTMRAVQRPRRCARSHATTVSRWFVMPIAATGSPSSAAPPRPAWRTRRPDLDGVVLDPARTGEVLRELAVRVRARAPVLVDGDACARRSSRRRSRARRPFRPAGWRGASGCSARPVPWSRRRNSNTYRARRRRRRSPGTA